MNAGFENEFFILRNVGRYVQTESSLSPGMLAKFLMFSVIRNSNL